jgi:flagellar motor switch/type III secretory pathway protein FliN
MSTTPQLPDSTAAADTWEAYADLRCTLSVEVAVPKFRVRDLLVLEAQSVVDSGWSHGMEVPVRLNGNVALTANFEVIGNHLALRLVEVV